MIEPRQFPPADPGALADALAGLGGFLLCEKCGDRRPLRGQSIRDHVQSGWPRCCGYTMRWWTQRQMEAGEAP